jgi:lipopolysaccharide/colanic/teichoic acid biosynthesis glycosyltransferase
MIRFFDIVLSSLAILILSPLLVPIAIGLKLTGEHDIFYLQRRAGMGGRDFKVIKFATMLRNSPNMAGGVLTQKNDPRVLPLGRFLRKTKINELPQLINVLRGDMSLVGPRPQARAHYEMYAPAVKRVIDGIPPGVTGIGSLVFRDEESLLDRVDGDRDHFHDEVIAPYKGELELWFARHRNLRSYIVLIALTAWYVVVPGSRLHLRLFRDLPAPPKALASFL